MQRRLFGEPPAPGTDAREVEIHDGWPQVDRFSVDREGFELHDFAARHQNRVDEQQRAQNHRNAGTEAHRVEHPQLVLNVHIVHAHHPLQVGLQCPGEGQRDGHEYHPAAHQPEGSHIEHLVIGITPAQDRHGIGDDREVDANVGSIEG